MDEEGPVEEAQTASDQENTREIAESTAESGLTKTSDQKGDDQNIDDQNIEGSAGPQSADGGDRKKMAQEVTGEAGEADQGDISETRVSSRMDETEDGDKKSEGEPVTVVSPKSELEATVAGQTIVSQKVTAADDDQNNFVEVNTAASVMDESNDGLARETLDEGETGAEADAEADAQPAASPARQSRLVIAGLVVIVILIIAGLFLPPISLGERLGLGGDETNAVESTGDGQNQQLDLNGEFSANIEGSTRGVKLSSLPRDSFLAGEEDEDWSAAAAGIPSNLTLVSNVYVIEYRDDPPVGLAQVQIPAAAQPYQTMDMYGWTGDQWRFMASDVSADGNEAMSTRGTFPQAIALMQTIPPIDPAISAEILPTQSMPPAVLPVLTELIVGTLTLNQDGGLLGEIATQPAGNYDQYMRVTNTGVIVDTSSLIALLRDPDLQERNIQEIVNRAVAGNFQGVNLDYQGVDPEQRGAFTNFVNNLASALGQQGLALSLILEPAILDGGEWDTAGQDWVALGQVADIVYAQMPLNPTVYDDSEFAEQFVALATRRVNRQKLSMLVSVNAVDAVGEAHRELAGDDALANFGELTLVSGVAEVEPGGRVEVALSGSAGDLAWDPDSLTYKYTYEQAGQPHNVWLGSDANLSHRSRFANRYNLRGIAVRGLGAMEQVDGYVKALESYLGRAESPQPASAAIVWAVEDDAGGVVASSSGEEMTYSWQAPEEAGTYVILANFAQGDSLASLGSVDVTVKAQATPTPTPEPTEEPEEEEEPEPTPTAAVVAPASVDPGDADAVANTPANVRSGPGLGFGIVGGINTGEKASLIGRNADRSWLQVKLADDTEGWVFATLLTVNSSFDVGSLAVVEVEAPAAAAGSGAAPAPVIAPAGGGSFELGGQTHTLANPTLMSAAGMNWVKFQHKWGPGDNPNAVAGRIQQAHANGFKVLLSIPGANAYPSSIDFNGYVEFLRGVAALGPDAIEVWNEENIDFEWPAGQIDPASYVNNMLAPAYNAIKSANSSVMVIGGAPAPTGFDNGTNAWSDQRYMAGVAAAGGANYMDCIGVHHNAGATSPNTASGHPAGNDHYSWYFFPTLNMYYNTFGGSRPVCFTELGFLSGQDFGGVPSRFSWAANTTVAQHAQWLAEAASLSANSGRVRLMIIFNVDFTHWGDDPQAGYAMLRPDGSCPSCGLLGQVMGR